MNQTEIDYGAVLADMEAKRDALSTAIENMRRWLGSASPGIAQPTQRGNGAEIPSDAFFSLSIPEAIKKYLGMVKGKKTTNDIAEALEKGGITHGSKNFRNSVSTALYREHDKPNGDIHKVGEGEWGLVDWYAGLRAKRMKATQSPAQAENDTPGASDDGIEEAKEGD
jgi:hypothetical protein